MQTSFFPESQSGRKRKHMTAEEAFLDFHRSNPRVYATLVAHARKVRDRGFSYYSIKTLFEVLRWHSDIAKDGEEQYKLNNNYPSRYARLIMKQEPDLKDFFNLRGLRS